MPETKPSIGSTPTNSDANRVGGSLMARLGDLLGKALADAAVLEVRTYTNEGGDAFDAQGDPLGAGSNSRLRAFTRIAIDGDTQVCIPVRADGEPNEFLWNLHKEAVAQAREDRAKNIDATIAFIRDIAGR